MTLRTFLLSISAFAAMGLSDKPALAHSEKESTTPADGAVLDTPPEIISMTFDSPMRLTMIRLIDADGVEIEVDRTDNMAPLTKITATPSALAPGTYMVEWRGLADDGHPMEGGFTFRIED